jgi:DNA-binding NarL/FixJ family response regulator
VSSIATLRTHIVSLTPGMNPEELEQRKRDMLALVDTITTVEAEPQSEVTHSRLSRREKEVMSMMLEGRRLKEIAAHLEISVKTVTTHRSRLMRKLSVQDNLGLYRYGIRNGLIRV